MNSLLPNVQAAQTSIANRKTHITPLNRQLAKIPNANQAKIIQSLDLCRESERLKTFTADWSSPSAPSAKDMAASGWFYLGNLDRTQCFSCGGVLRNWRKLDNPNVEHITHFPHCAMAQGRENRNIPDEGKKASWNLRRRYFELSEQQKANLLVVFPCEFPITPMMMSAQERLKTFNNHWPFTRATPQMLASAGFFYLGVRDRVKCFYCNGGLQNWRQDDVPWEEHAKWYPNCEFLLQKRGPEFVHSIVAQFPNLKRPTLQATGNDVVPSFGTRSQHAIASTPVRGAVASASDGEKRNKQVLKNSAETKVARGEYKVEREVEMIETVIGMGFDESLVKIVMQEQKEKCGFGFDSTTALFEAVTIEQRRKETEEEQQTIANVAAGCSSNAFCRNEDKMDAEERNENELDTNSMNVDEQMPDAPSNLLFIHESNSSVMKNKVGRSCTPQKCRPVVTSQSTESQINFQMKLKKQLMDLEDQRRCKVCLDRLGDMVYVPCGHICCCMECTRGLKSCPMCRTKIDQAIRTYTS